MNFGFLLYYGTTIVHGPVGRPLTADLLDRMHQFGNLDGGFYAPSLLEDISESPPEMLKNLEMLKFVISSGGPLNPKAGEVISTKVPILGYMGSTEAGLLPTVYPEPEDWMYYHFHPWSGVEFRHVDGDVYECVITRNENLPGSQGIFQTFPDIQEYETHDLYSKHPTKPDRWIYRGRSDDVIVLSNGEKFNPVTMEQFIGDHPLVRTALVVGQARFQSSLIIELANPDITEQHENLVADMWSAVEKANLGCPQHGKIAKSMIIFTSAAKPLKRSPKGTILRSASAELYRDEIDALYIAQADGALETGPPLSTPEDPERMLIFTRQLISQTFQDKALEDTQDFFIFGMDSLQVLQIVRRIKSALKEIATSAGVNLASIGPSLVYLHPTIQSLALAVNKLFTRSTANGSGDTILDKQQRKIQLLIEKYSLNLPRYPNTSEDSWNVILTGSTGSLGSYLLSSLLAHPKVAKVYCFNRSAEGEAKQTQGNRERGLSTDFSKVVFLRSQLGEPDFGLGQGAYDELIKTVTHVIHNAWHVDFNMAVESFEKTHIAGIRHLIDFLAASASYRHARLLFISSLSTVGKWTSIYPGRVPEESIEDIRVVEDYGYAQSKYVAERLLASARSTSKLPAVTVRVGQVAGPTCEKGAWNRHEWLPAMLSSSKYLGLLPDSLGALETIDWIPVDILSRIIVDLAESTGSANPDIIPPVYHTVNPFRTTWKELLPTVHASLGKHLKVIPLDKWIRALEESAADMNDDPTLTAKIPAVKIMPWVRRLQLPVGSPPPTQLETERAEAASETMRQLVPVTEEWMETWMHQWTF
jgi:thioester reductase-like protein